MLYIIGRDTRFRTSYLNVAHSVIRHGGAVTQATPFIYCFI